ncbi:LuxR C-terminal-related transcriptional regulator [Streptomyces sp. NPDC006314]|uniref:helix-turn-helix transcriptional regulator n=1 Tax=Streptomyces sp. NPDC006314 TaxID=3154475 RepID=UPI0033AA320C
MSTAPHPRHGVEELCAAGAELYTRALREGHVTAVDAVGVPCLVGFGLLRPAAGDPERLEPVPPAVALHRLLRSAADRIAGERRREALLADAFEPLMRIDGRRTENTADTPTLRVLSGTARINEAITEAMSTAHRELLCVQPHHELNTPRGHASQSVAVRRDQAVLDRGGRIRTLYQHTLRHRPSVAAYYEQLSGDTEARSLDEVTDRLIVVDRTVAFLPANADGTLALEVRHPALLTYFVTIFDRLWQLATPMYPRAVQRPSVGGVTPRQRSIAALLVEGHTDAVIAERLGMNVRTARVHIAKLATTLGSESRAQLGYLIGRSGILDRQEEAAR